MNLYDKNKPLTLIRSKKLEKRISSCEYDFEMLKAMYGSRMIIIDRQWCYVGREDTPDYVKYNSLIAELFREHSKVFFGYCRLLTNPRMVYVSSFSSFSSFSMGASVPYNGIKAMFPYTQQEVGPIYIGGKTEKEILSVLDRADRFMIMK